MFWGLDAGQLSLLFLCFLGLYNVYSWVSRTYREITSNMRELSEAIKIQNQNSLRQLSEAVKTQNQNLQPIKTENNSSNFIWNLLYVLMPVYNQVLTYLCHKYGLPNIVPDVMGKIFNKSDVLHFQLDVLTKIYTPKIRKKKSIVVYYS